MPPLAHRLGHAIVRRMTKAVRSFLPWVAPLIAYASVGWGTARTFGDVWPLVVGALLWLDLFMYARK